MIAVGDANATRVALHHQSQNCYLKKVGDSLHCVNEEISKASTFKVESGALVPPVFEIIDVKFQTQGLDNGEAKGLLIGWGCESYCKIERYRGKDRKVFALILFLFCENSFFRPSLDVNVLNFLAI